MDADDPWAGILSAASFAMKSTFHTTLKATPGQLVFGRDMILNIQHEADWQAIKDRKQRLINYNNQRENSKRIPHTYRVGDKFILKKDANKYETDKEGPYDVLQVNTNGTIVYQKGAVIDTVNIRRCTPYYETTE